MRTLVHGFSSAHISACVQQRTHVTLVHGSHLEIEMPGIPGDSVTYVVNDPRFPGSVPFGDFCTGKVNSQSHVITQMSFENVEDEI